MILDWAGSMRIAVPDWQGRVSPVFDVAAHLVLAEVEDGRIVERRTAALENDGLSARAARIASLGVEVLICGAISRPLELALVNRGVQVVPQTCGEVPDVLASFAKGKFSGKAFLMPGCGGRRRRRLRGQHRYQQAR
jgi:predicted Fe-Mo cluster-binding NifX family protein